jgi:hypothetical protein
LQAGPAEAVLQVQDDLAALDPEQMVPGAGRIAFRNADGEDVDMPRRDLKRVSAMIEQPWVTAVERDVARRSGASLLPGRGLRLLRKGFGHS